MLLYFLLLPASLLAQPGVVATADGPVRGTPAGATWSYKRIPFAAAPVGALRYLPPQPAAPWRAIRDGSTWGPLCPQLDRGRVVGEEDCLQLNVWTPNPAPSRPAPVLFWIHGGGHVQGGAPIEEQGVRIYDGERLSARTAAVVVTTNYRLGALGYLALPELSTRKGSSGNLGTLDQIAALEWVRRNIAAFGGDPSRVMIAGESAGAVAVCALLSSPAAAGLFQSAAIQSGGCTAFPLERAEAFGRTVAEAAGCATDTARCLRTRPVETILRAVSVDVGATEPAVYSSVVDGIVQPAPPLEAIETRRHHPVPVIVGANSDETSRMTLPVRNEAAYVALVYAKFGQLAPVLLRAYPVRDYESPRAAYVAMTSDARFICPSRRTVRALASAQSQPVFRYFFTHTPQNATGDAGAWHGFDVLYLFESIYGIGGYQPGPTDRAVAASFATLWTNLAAQGDPTPGSLFDWPRWNATDPYLVLASPLSTGQGVRTAQCDLWDRLAEAQSR